jgi:hypothetical protein
MPQIEKKTAMVSQSRGVHACKVEVEAEVEVEVEAEVEVKVEVKVGCL